MPKPLIGERPTITRPVSGTQVSGSIFAVFGTGPEAGRRGAQMDEEFCYTPLANDFGPGPDGAAGGRAGGRGICFSTLLAANFEPGLDGAAKLCSVTGPNTI